MKFETVNEDRTTHNFIHENALDILINDLDEENYFINVDNITMTKIGETLKYLYVKKEIFQNYANYPDMKERDYYFEIKKNVKNGVQVKGIRCPVPLFSNHFFSPHEGTSYINKLFNRIYKIVPESMQKIFTDYQNQGGAYNAMELFLYHTEKAINNYHTDSHISERVISELSKACHYLEDMNETHHVTNKIAFFSNHRKFEYYVNKNMDLFKISSAKEFCKISSLKIGEKQFWEKYNFYTKFISVDYLKNRSGTDALLQVCRWISISCSCFATGTDDLYSANTSEGLESVDLYLGTDKEKSVLISKSWERASWALSNDEEKWKLNIEQTLKMAQISVASFIFVFILYITEPNLFNYKS